MRGAFIFTSIRLGLAALAGVLAFAPGAPVEAQTNQGRSLSLAQYIARGLPAVDRAWSATDYPDAARVLRTLPRSELPQTANPQTAVIVDRLTDAGSLRILSDPSLRLENRLGLCASLMDASGQILRIYVDALQQDAAFAEDVIRVLGFNLQGSAAMNDLVEEFIPRLDRNDPTYETRMSGVARTRLGLTQVMQGAIVTLQVQGVYPEPARARFAGIVAGVFPRIAPALPQQTRAEIELSLRRVAQRDRSAAVRAALAPLASAQAQ